MLFSFCFNIPVKPLSSHTSVFASSVQHANRTRYSGCVQVAYLQPFQICCIKRCQVGTCLSLSKVLSEWILLDTSWRGFFGVDSDFWPLFCDSLTGGSIVGDMAPYQAFAIGGLGSVRGYGEGAVGSGRSCLVANTELALPLVSLAFIVALASEPQSF